MPLFSPYHKFFFSEGFTVVPPPTDPYLPSSGRLLTEFLPNPASALGNTGSIGAGRTASLGCFNFNALGMSLGCDSMGPNCDWHFTGIRFNAATGAQDVIANQDLSTPPCPALSKCVLIPVTLDSSFENLSEIRISSTVAGVPKIWWMDDFKGSWYNTSCDAVACRQKNI
jgi:hypothetical protein